MRSGLKWLAALLAAALMAWPTLARAAWVQAETDRFIVVSAIGEKQTRAFVEELHQFDAMLRQLYGVNAPPTRKLELFLTDTRDQMEKVLPGRPEAVLGVYLPHRQGLVALAYGRGIDPAEQEALSSRAVVFHEYAHHFMFQHFRAAFPVWFTEGFAEYVSTARFKKNTAELGWVEPGRARTLQSLSLLETEDFLTLKRQGATRRDIDLLYAQGWLTVHYFYADVEREAKLQRYLQTMMRAPGGDQMAIFQDATGLSAPAFKTALRKYMSGRLPVLSFPLEQTEVAIAVQPLSEAQAERRMLSARLRVAASAAKDAADLLERLQADAEREPQDALAWRNLGHGLLLAQRFEEADAALIRAADLAPEEADGWWLRGLLEVARGKAEPESLAARRAAAARHFEAAVQRDVTHFPSYLDWARVARSSEEQLALFAAAWRIAPQVDDAAIGLGQALLRQQRYDESLNILRPVAARPHGGGAAEYARRLIERAESRQSRPEATEAELEQ